MQKDKNNEMIDTKSAALDALEDFKKVEAERKEASETRQAEKAKKNKMWAVGRWIILIVCAGITIFQMPKLISSLNKEEKPLRRGTFETDARTDQCIRNLWQISRLIQEGEMPDDNIICPAGKKPYLVVRTEDDIIVRSPNPELYGYKDIRVSQKNPVPEIVE